MSSESIPHSPRTENQLEGKLWAQKSRMSGVSVEKLGQAFKTFENSAGPG